MSEADLGTAVAYSVRTDYPVAVLTIKKPPVNSLGLAVRKGLYYGIRKAAADPAVKAVVIIGDGATFPAGADISEFQGMRKLLAKRERGPFPLPDVIQDVEDLKKPVVAAIHGTALGGGLELALGCHYRVALASASVGLPEVQLGIIPGAGGTQRLPRVTDLGTALKMITTGAPIKAPVALKTGIIDHVIPNATTREQLLEAAVLYAAVTAKNPGFDLNDRRLSKKKVLPYPPQHIFDMSRGMAKKTARGFLAPLGCIDAVEAACYSPDFATGLRFEQETIAKLMLGTQAQAQQYFFFAQREAGKVPGVPKIKGKHGVKQVGVIGAGTMGQGIAMCFIEAGIEAILLDIKQEFIEKGIETIKKNYASQLKKKTLTKQRYDGYLKLLKSSTDYASFKNADMVIEAVFESMDIKKKVMKTLDDVCKPGALLCTNTSTLDIDEIAKATRRPEVVVGTHFFSPANKMKLLEVVKGAKTSPETIATVLAVGKSIKKVSVVVGNCFGFVGNRMIEWYAREASSLVEEGATPEQVDGVLYKFGMAMGPFAMGDLAGNDVGYKIRQALGILGKDGKPVKSDERYAGRIADRLVQAGRLGQKTGKGWYKYGADRRPKPDPEVTKIIEEVRKELGITPRKISEQEILERTLYPLINDGFNILQERIAIRPSDIDVIYVYGYGFPVYRGGPMFYADTVGLKKVRDSLIAYGKQHPTVKHWKVSPFLDFLVSKNMSLQDFVMSQVKKSKAKL